jgi:hypothetical protein
LILNHLLGTPEASFDAEEIRRSVCFRSGSDLCYEQDSSLDEAPKRTSDHISTQQLIKHSTKDMRIQEKEEFTIINVAERFLGSFRNATFSGITIELQGSHPSNTDALENGYSEPSMQAFQCCKSMALQANEQLKHASFTRFISLCFFLVWKAFACKTGKSGARMVYGLNERHSMCCIANYSSDKCEDERGRV